jgi:hypothetical protein
MGRWLVPAFSTTEALPERTHLEWPFWRDRAWKLLPDYRGRMLYRQDNGEATEILAAGTTPAEHGLTETPRPSDEYTWREGAWKIDPAVIAKKVRAAAMAEFDMRMNRARSMNNGKSDAYAAGLLSVSDAYYFRAWSAYQLDLVRAIQAEGFPDAVNWPAEPVTFEQASAPAMAEFDRRMAIVLAKTDGKADAYAARTLPAKEFYEYQVWTAYQEALRRAITRETFPTAVVWPDEPAPYSPPSAPVQETPTQPADESSAQNQNPA